MQSVTSNAVAQALERLIKYKDIQINFSSLSFIQYANGGYYCNVPVSSFLSDWSHLWAITSTYWTALDCRGFYLGFDSDMANITIIVETYNSSAYIRARIVYS